MATTNNIQNANPYKEVTVQLQSGPATYEINEIGYGFAVLECDDQSGVVYVETTQSNPIPLTEVGTISFPGGFNKLVIKNFETVIGTEVVSLLIYKSTDAYVFPISPFREVADAMTSFQWPILAAGNSSIQYDLWEVNAASTETQTYTPANMQYFPSLPLINSIQILSIASGSQFALATTAITSISSLEPTLQPSISSTYFTALPAEFKVMGYTAVYTPTVTASGTNVFLISLQQPLTMAQLSAFYGI